MAKDSRLLVSLNQWDGREHGENEYHGVYEGRVFAERIDACADK